MHVSTGRIGRTSNDSFNPCIGRSVRTAAINRRLTRSILLIPRRRMPMALSARPIDGGWRQSVATISRMGRWTRRTTPMKDDLPRRLGGKKGRRWDLSQRAVGEREQVVVAGSLLRSPNRISGVRNARTTVVELSGSNPTTTTTTTPFKPRLAQHEHELRRRLRQPQGRRRRRRRRSRLARHTARTPSRRRRRR